MKSLLLVLAFSLMPVSCVPGGGGEEPTTLIPPKDTVVATVVGEIGWGTRDGYEFGDVTSVAFGPSGEVVTVDQFLHQVAIFDSTGTFLRAFGGSGDGPGELTSALGVGVLPDGRIGVVSHRLTRYTVFSWDGEPLDVKTMSYRGQGSVWLGVVGNAGTVYDYVMDFSQGMDPFQANTIGRIRMASSGIATPDHLAVLPWHAPSGIQATHQTRGDGEIIHPFSIAQLWSVAADGTYASLTQDSLEIRVSTFDGELVSKLGVGTPSKQTDRADQSVAEVYLRSFAPAWNVPNVTAIPKLPIFSVYLDPDQRLWVSRTPVVEVLSRTSEGLVDRHDLRGGRSVTIRLPKGVRPSRPYFTGSGDRALAIVEDELGRQTVLILAIPHPPEGIV